MPHLWHISLFAGLAEQLGSRTLVLSLDEDRLPVGELKRRIADAHPDHAQAVYASFAARNQAYADDAELARCEDELALLPPVSGGSGDGGETAGDRPPRYVIQTEPLDAAAVASAVAHPDHGATLLFIGTTREWTDGQRTVRLSYEAYEPMALASLRQIGDEIAARWPGTLTAVAHRIGEVGVGEASVVIAVSSPHRASGYEASRYAIERLKQIVPIWKKEIYEDGSSWIGHQLGPWNPLTPPDAAT